MEFVDWTAAEAIWIERMRYIKPSLISVRRRAHIQANLRTCFLHTSMPRHRHRLRRPRTQFIKTTENADKSKNVFNSNLVVRGGLKDRCAPANVHWQNEKRKNVHHEMRLAAAKVKNEWMRHTNTPTETDKYYNSKWFNTWNPTISLILFCSLSLSLSVFLASFYSSLYVCSHLAAPLLSLARIASIECSAHFLSTRTLS